MTRPTREGANAFIKERECLWGRVSGRGFYQDSTFQALGFDETRALPHQHQDRRSGSDMGAGLDFIGPKGADLTLFYEGRFGDLVRYNAGGLKASLKFQSASPIAKISRFCYFASRTPLKTGEWNAHR
jgi:hypothetical protein